MPTTVDLAVGERTRIVDGVDVTFIGNSHKIMERGESPLGISLTVHRDGRDIDTSEWVELLEQPKFSAAGITFEYLAHRYDRSVRLRVISVGPVEE